MADRRRREMRVTDDDEYKDEPSRSIPGQDVQESPAEKKARIDRMIEVQVEALGRGRRHIISTRDHPENMIEVDLDFIQRRRRINQSGTAESRVAPETVEKLSLWNNAHASLEDDGTADEGLQDLAAGQTHRAKLMNLSPQDYNITRGQEDAGRRGSPRTRGGARGGRGGGVVGTRGRGARPSRGPSVGIAPPLPRSPVVRLPPVAPVLQAFPSSMATSSLNERRGHSRRQNEVPANVRELSTRHYDGRLATPSDFMASLTTHGLLASTSLLDGPAEDEPTTSGAAQASATEAAPLGTEVAASDALFKFIEGDAANAPDASTSTQAESTLHVGDLQGLEMIEGLASSKTERDMIRLPPVGSSTVTAPFKTEEKTQGSGMWEAYMKMELHNLFPAAKKGTAQKHITEYYKATVVKEDGADIVPSTSEAAAVKGKGRANSLISEADEGTARKVSQSTTQQLRRSHDEFTKVVQDGFDPTNLIFTGSLSNSRWAPRERSASTFPVTTPSLPPHLARDAPPPDHGAAARSQVQAQVIDAPGSVIGHAVSQVSTGQNVGPSRSAARDEPSSIVAPLTSGRDPGHGNTRASTLSAHLPSSSGLSDPGAVVRQQYGGARGGALAPNPTRQLPAASATVVGRGRGAAVSIPTGTSSGMIRPGVGQSIWNRGGFPKKG